MKFGNGGIKFGLKPHKPFDNSVKTYTLSPEELEKYMEGKPVLTKDKYLERKSEGKTDQQIMKEFEMNSVSINAFKKKHDLLGIRKPRNAGEHDDWKTKYEVLEARFKELEQRTQDVNDDNNKELLDSALLEVEKKEHELKEAKATVGSLMADNEDLTKRLNDGYISYSELEEQHKKIQELAKEQQVQLDKMRESYESMDREIERLTTENAILHDLVNSQSYSEDINKLQQLNDLFKKTLKAVL
ncbi:hypothetical protein M3689_05750 [Alkalihalophilus marmarensis]|uniref:hypothetical protein n=1 Tax=Alkalihalophilus marmarensis TaxID=521377 RepID=UPI0020414B77|nr:hypothetical protein [Alkalihalophilus marmarensis]MCM3488809.1 hypothetical protein [Alkalihalophilus marmarensis]